MFRNLIVPDRWWSLVLVAFGGKLLLLVLVLLEHHIPLNGDWYFSGGDTTGYTEPIDSLLNGSGYQPDSRMPGYGVPYLLLRLIMSMHAAMQGLVLLQVLASAFGVVLLAKLAYKLTDDPRVFRWTYWLALLAIFSSFYDRFILTESFSAAALVFVVYAIITLPHSKGYPRILTAGAAMAWLIFMKPVFLPLLAVFGLYLLLTRKDAGWTRLLCSALFCMPFLLADGIWIARNAMLHDVFRPLSDGVVSPAIREDIKYPVMGMISAFGGSFLWWDPHAEIVRFNIRAEGVQGDVDTSLAAPVPRYFYTDRCTRDSVERIAMRIGTWNRSSDPIERAALRREVEGRCERCVQAFREQAPFHYHITSRLRMLRISIFSAGNPELMAVSFGQLSPIKKGIKLFYMLFYLVALVPALMFCPWHLLRRRSPPALKLASMVVLYGVLIFSFGMRFTETRYLTTVYPIALLITVLSITQVLGYFYRRRSEAAAS